MKKLEEVTTRTYQLQDDYCVDVIETDEMFEAWLYDRTCIMKLFVLGEPKVQCLRQRNGRYAERKTTIDDFIERIEVYIKYNNLIDDYVRDLDKVAFV